ncbi:TetR/AcrR family transcriptional regulator [Mucilaginibacter myungsuensis]|uniref:TetR/AcrR family transcriptional regulator n=1 Tax=Mucilaginibacter myungsuensis TaxID=649104 RepID=A0A929PWJ2_9SPHI|nr:TetR/AcrR family transcriptional regulator [Mucilaginibacter myungsuensis]MBE9662194.1 TetR/AcrR family transcriptional regulator [Mucilaginibacter myungsuensis]MDN3599372.1 TetR/AcrR family transcriptional regulator [Mucilaginibacter myungsuensis]
MNTDQLIVDAAIATFDSDPSAPLEQVAERAGVTRRTLHRYFKDRAELLTACETTMQDRCLEAIKAALHNHSAPMAQLEQVLYALIDCGSKYTFLKKKHEYRHHQHASGNTNCNTYDRITGMWQGVIILLQNLGQIDKELPSAWIFQCFTGMIGTAVTALQSGDIAVNDIKKLAWGSFSKSIGLTTNNI